MNSLVSAELTAGLNKPPLILKKTQTFIARLKPKTKEMYVSCVRFGPVLVEPCVPRLAICVPPKAKKRKKKVPMNSPREATKWFLMFLPKAMVGAIQ